MEEVDKIIIVQLKQLGCEIDAGVTNMGHFDSELLFRACVICLKFIGAAEAASLPDTLPSDMGSRYRACTTVAEAIEGMHYRGTAGYNLFMYPNDKDVRKLLSFLLESLPQKGDGARDSAGSGAGAGGAGAESIEEQIQKVLLRAMKSSWVPNYCRHAAAIKSNNAALQRQLDTTSFPIASSPLSTIHIPANQYQASYASKYLDLVTQQPPAVPLVVPTPGTRVNMASVLSAVKSAHQAKLAASVIQDNSAGCASYAASEAEWSTLGIDSGLNREDYIRRKREDIDLRIQNALRAYASRRTTDSNIKNISDIVSQLSTMQDKKREESKHRSRVQLETKFDHEQQTDSGPATAGATPAPEQETQEQIEERRRQEVEELQTKLDKLNTALVAIQREIETQTTTQRQLEESIQSEQKLKIDLEDEYTLKKKTRDLLDDKENNMRELRTISSASAQRLMELAGEWENHRQPLIEKLRGLKQAMADRKNTYRMRLEEIKANREKMKTMIHDIKAKEELLKKLNDDYARLPKDIERSTYVDRILDIVKNVKKQNTEINKINLDNRALQKEIATISDALSRTFIVTEDLIYKDAVKEESSKKVYKNLVELKQTFEELISNVEEIGLTVNQMRDLETQLDQINASGDAQNSERIVADLEQVKKENATLIQYIKQQLH